MIPTPANASNYALRNPNTRTRDKFPKKTHPNPKHARAKEQLKALHKLGIENFADVPVSYWEPLISGETTTEHNVWRQKECQALDDWIRKETEKHRLATGGSNDDVSSGVVTVSRADIEAIEAENESLQKRSVEADTTIKALRRELESERTARLEVQEQLRKSGVGPGGVAHNSSPSETALISGDSSLALKNTINSLEAVTKDLERANKELTMEKTRTKKLEEELVREREFRQRLEQEVSEIKAKLDSGPLPLSHPVETDVIGRLTELMGTLIEEKLCCIPEMVKTQVEAALPLRAASMPAEELNGFAFPRYARRKWRKNLKAGPQKPPMGNNERVEEDPITEVSLSAVVQTPGSAASLFTFDRTREIPQDPIPVPTVGGQITYGEAAGSAGRETRQNRSGNQPPSQLELPRFGFRNRNKTSEKNGQVSDNRNSGPILSRHPSQKPGIPVKN